MRRFRKIVLLALGVCALPLLAIGLADGLAYVGQCSLDDHAGACRVGGLTIDAALHGLNTVGWLALLTLPTAGATRRPRWPRW